MIIEDLTIKGADWGIRNKEINSLELTNVKVTDNYGSGVVFENNVENVIIKKSKFLDNGDFGIYFNKNSNAANVTVKNTNVNQNGHIGFSCQGSIAALEITGGSFNNNKGGETEISYGETKNYYGFGIELANSNGIIKNITAKKNGTNGPDIVEGEYGQEGGAGIVVRGNSNITIENATLEENMNGLWIEDPDSVAYWGGDFTGSLIIKDSTIRNNEEFGAMNPTKITVDATKNYWGTASKTEIEAMILGSIDYNPWYKDEEKTTLITAGDPDGIGGEWEFPDGGTSTSTPSATLSSELTVNATTSSIVLPAGTVITRADGENFGLDDITSEEVEEGALAGFEDWRVVEGSLQFGIPAVGLKFDPAITIKIFVGTDLNGQTLNIMRSVSGSDGWTSEGIANPTCVVANGYCEFQTTLASYFATTSGSAPASSGSFAMGGSFSGSTSSLLIMEETVKTTETGETSATITWTTSYPSTSQVIYSQWNQEHAFDWAKANYGYAYSTAENTEKSSYHSVTITGLNPGTTYYFRTVSRGSLAISQEYAFTTRTVAGESTEMQFLPFSEIEGQVLGEETEASEFESAETVAEATFTAEEQETPEEAEEEAKNNTAWWIWLIIALVAAAGFVLWTSRKK